jgi:hypothetical protein
MSSFRGYRASAAAFIIEMPMTHPKGMKMDMVEIQNVLDDGAPAVSQEGAPQCSLSGTAKGETAGQFQMPDRLERGRSLLSGSIDPLPRRSLFRR